MKFINAVAGCLLAFAIAVAAVAAGAPQASAATHTRPAAEASGMRCAPPAKRARIGGRARCLSRPEVLR